jgi:hypothetical protein
MEQATSLEFLQRVYRDPEVNLHIRIRCAMACLQYEHPKLVVVAQVTEQGFAELLERRLQNLKRLENGSKALAIADSRPQIDVLTCSPTCPHS